MIYRFILFLLFPLAFAADNLKEAKLDFDDKLPDQRWIFESKPSLSKNAVHTELYKLKKAVGDQHFKTCILTAGRLWNMAPVLRNWISANELFCRHQQFKKDKAKEMLGLHQYLDRISSKNSEWLFSGPQADVLRERFIQASLDLLIEQVSRSRKTGWSNAFRLVQYSDYLSAAEMARLYRGMGELAFAEQNLSAALDYFERSMALQDQADVRKRIDVISRELKRSRPDVVATPTLIQSADTATEAELKLFDRFKSSVRSKDYVSAVEDGVDLIVKYPGSEKADQAAKQILSIYLALADSSNENIRLIKAQVITAMKKCDGQRLFDWAQVMAAREYYQDAISLAGDSLKLVGGQPVSTQVLLLIAQSSLHSGEFDLAAEYFSLLQEKHAGTKAAAESYFRLGLVQYRQKKYSESALMFEKYLSQPFKDDFEVSSYYWLWRSRQKTKSEVANEARDHLIRNFPLSYYGLRAQIERDNGKVSFAEAENPKAWKLSLWLSPAKYESWERVLLLVGGNWFEEAHAELEELPTPATPAGKVVLARVWGAALDHFRAFELVQQAWRQDAKFVNTAVVRMIYPREFSGMIKPEAKRYGLPEDLVLSLMRQESSFRPRVESPAGARGLMQVMRATGREVARDLRIRGFDANEDLYDASINVRIGTNYLYRLMRAFDGQVPLALAAYNAGIGNVRGWMKSRSDLSLAKMKGTDPDEELWFDELPWLETSGYIKNILRNLIIYKALDQREAQFEFPIWTIRS